MEKKQGSTTVKAEYRIYTDGDNVKVDLKFEVRKSGVAGTGKGVMAFQLIDGEGKPLFAHDKGFTVGADMLTGVATKTFEQSFTLFGGAADTLRTKGGGVAFTAQVERDTAGIPTSPNEWTSLLGSDIPDVLADLDVGKAREINGWSVKRIVK
jgi:hypothetical protein